LFELTHCVLQTLTRVVVFINLT